MTNSAIDLQSHLRRHLDFIETSCSLFDSGKIEEAIRIAVSLRVLFHDHDKSSISLLTLMDKKSSIRLLSTMEFPEKDLLDEAECFYAPVEISLDGVKPMLHDSGRKVLLPCIDWWNEVVAVQKYALTRSEVIRITANKDGGAHVQASPDDNLSQLKEGIGAHTKLIGENLVVEELINHHFLLLRQMGHEILNSPDLTALA